MKCVLLVTVGLMLSISPSHAMRCADGVYRVACAGPNGAAVARKPYSSPSVNCAQGAYAEGCKGPNGAVVRRTP